LYFSSIRWCLWVSPKTKKTVVGVFVRFSCALQQQQTADYDAFMATFEGPNPKIIHPHNI
jgi:hypothetical protein